MAYTPFLSQIGQTLGRGLEAKGLRQQKQAEQALVQSAYMGEPGALERLSSVNPQVANQIKREKVSGEQRKLQDTRYEKGQERISEQDKLAALKELRGMEGEVQGQIANMDYEQANAYMSKQIEMNKPLIDRAGVDVESLKLTPEAYEQIKKINGAGGKETPFAGTGMEAQVGNILSKGVDDPAYRNTPEYALAWKKINEPNIIRTPTGDIPMMPQIPEMFKPPGIEAQKEPIPKEQALNEPTKTEEPGLPKQAYIPGTEKISADQKTYNKDFTILKKSYDSMQNYIDILDELGPQMSIGPLNATDAQKLESAYSRAMLDAKETNNLGVLNGPDLGIMRKLMGDPIGITGQIKGKEALMTGAEESMKQITDNFSSLNEIMADSPVKTKELSPPKKVTPKINESDLSVTIDGKVYRFPDENSLNEYRKEAGL